MRQNTQGMSNEMKQAKKTSSDHAAAALDNIDYERSFAWQNLG